MPESSPSLLADKWAVVTGSSGGIGRAIATEFAAAGCSLILHGNSACEAVNEFADSLRAQGGQSEVLLCDFSDKHQLSEFPQRAWDTVPIDIWVNNAGADVLTGSAAELSFDQKLELLWQVDVNASIQLSREIGDRMRQRGSGVLLNIGWDQSELGMEGDSGEMFAASKGAITCFTRSLAKSLAPQVRVNCIAPGWIKTAWGESASDYWQQRAEQESLVGRWGTPEDVAKAALFLASPMADFITGHVLPVNGGRP